MSEEGPFSSGLTEKQENFDSSKQTKSRECLVSENFLLQCNDQELLLYRDRACCVARMTVDGRSFEFLLSEQAQKDLKTFAEGPSKVNKYERKIYDIHDLKKSVQVDVYSVLETFEVNCPASQHAIKKLLCAGQRGHKDRHQDLREARDAISRALKGCL